MEINTYGRNQRNLDLLRKLRELAKGATPNVQVQQTNPWAGGVIESPAGARPRLAPMPQSGPLTRGSSLGGTDAGLLKALARAKARRDSRRDKREQARTAEDATIMNMLGRREGLINQGVPPEKANAELERLRNKQFRGLIQKLRKANPDLPTRFILEDAQQIMKKHIEDQKERLGIAY